MSWSRASLLSKEKSGSSGASGRWGKAMAAVTGAAGWEKTAALRSAKARGSPSGLGTDFERSPEGALTLQLR